MHTLLHFKQGVIDASAMLSSWLTQHDCCHWTGVECHNITGRVMELNLPCHLTDNDDKSHCLTGELNLSLLQLEFLSYLNLSNNAFMGIHHSWKCVNMSRDTHSHTCRETPPTSTFLICHIIMIFSLIISIGFPAFPPCNILTLVVLIFTRKLIGFKQ